jgi:hypothetical protein
MFAMQTHCVFFKARCEFLNVMYRNLLWAAGAHVSHDTRQINVKYGELLIQQPVAATDTSFITITFKMNMDNKR